MPWQQQVADVCHEIDPDTGLLWYREVRLTVPRQQGKTTLLLPRAVWRAEAAHLLGGRQKMVYTAQTGAAAFEKFDEDFIEDLAAARAMRGRWRHTNVGGRKRIRFRSGSLWLPVAPTSKGTHGKTLDDGVHDEAFAAVDGRVEDAWAPAMITRANAQLWVVSTAGDEKSLYLRDKTRDGRAIAEGQVLLGSRSSRVAYFEWSADPAADPHDPATWWSCMPALGLTVTEDAIQHQLETMRGGVPAFRRAYLNQWAGDFDVQVWVLPRASWQNCADPASERDGMPALAVEVAPGRATSAVSMAAARSGDGLPMVATVRHGEGVEWLTSHLEQLISAKGATCVVMDGVGPISSMREEIENVIRGRCPLWVTTTGERADADAQMLDAVVTEQLRHGGQPELDSAVAGAAWKTVGDRQLFDRRKSGADISALVSASLALAGLKRHPGPDQIVY